MVDTGPMRGHDALATRVALYKVNQHGIGRDDAFKLILDQVVMVWLGSQWEQAELFSFPQGNRIEVLTEVQPALTPASYMGVSSLVK